MSIEEDKKSYWDFQILKACSMVCVQGMFSTSQTIPLPLVKEINLWLISLEQPAKNVTTNYSLDLSKLGVGFFHLPDGCLIGSWARSHFRLWLNDLGQYLWLLPDRGHWRKLKHSPMLHIWQKNKFLTVWYIKGGIFSSGQPPGISWFLKQSYQVLPLGVKHSNISHQCACTVWCMWCL